MRVNVTAKLTADKLLVALDRKVAHWRLDRFEVSNQEDVVVLLADWFDVSPKERKDGKGWKVWQGKTHVEECDAAAWAAANSVYGYTW